MEPRLHMVLVNDDEDGLFLLERAMKREFPAADIIACRNAREALALVTQGAVDLLITDNRMPEISGIELVRRMRADGRQMPVVMLTGCEAQKAEALAAGVTLFISGGGWTEIRAIVRRVVDEAPSAALPPPSME